METSLDTEQKRAAYHASDGSKGTREVASKAGYGSKSTIEALWKKWRRLGLGESFQVKGGGERFRRSFDLEDFEIEVPKSVRAKDNQSAAESAGANRARGRSGWNWRGSTESLRGSLFRKEENQANLRD